jgi:hypothetical protein
MFYTIQQDIKHKHRIGNVLVYEDTWIRDYRMLISL